jgi:cytochrome c biogenesis protein CcmG, thiol:disulfide interchange protein DsbE
MSNSRHASFSSRATRPTLVVALALMAAACGGAAGEAGGAASPNGAKHDLLNNPAPDFTAETVNGKGKFSLAQAKGKVVLVDFWATWCEPCKKSFPKLEELRVKYASSGLEIAAISEDDEQNGVKEFGENYGAKFSLLWDKDKSIANKWHPPNMPSSFIVDKKGVVRFVHLGYHEGEEKEIEAEVKSLL